MTTEFFNKEILDKVECSEELLQFYIAYKQWLDEGSPVGDDIFMRNCGLCTNLISYCAMTEYEHSQFILLKEMQKQFDKFGLDDVYPFNGIRGYNLYEQETMTDTCHSNDERVEWVTMWSNKYKGVSNDNN